MKQKQLKRPFYTRLPMIFLGVFIALYPLSCFPVTLTLSGSELAYVPNIGGTLTDLCVRSREIILFAAAVFLILFLLGERIFPDHPIKSPLFDKTALPLTAGTGLFILLTVISGIFSQHPELSFWGISSENTGIAAFIGFAAIFLTAYEGGAFPEDMRYIITGATVSGLLCGVMLLFELLFGQLTHLLWGTGESAGTMLLFGSSTSCGEYCALLFPFLIASALSEERRAAAILQAAAAGGAICTAFSSRSSTAFYGIIAELSVLAVFGVIRAVKARKIRLKRLYLPAAVAIPLAALLLVQPRILTSAAENRVSYSSQDSWHLTDAVLSENELRLTNPDSTLIISVTDGGVTLTDPCGKTALLTADVCEATISGVTAALNGGILTLDLGYADKLRFAVIGGRPGYVGMNGYIQPLDRGAFPELSEYYSTFTGRGYIWLNTLPILTHCAVIGVGAGQFCYHYPQNDIVGALNTHGTANLLTDKPHSMYLGIAVSCGIPALLLFLALTVVVIKRGAVSAMGGGAVCGAFASVIGALIMGITNDISVVYIPVMALFSGLICSRQNNPGQ